MGVKLTPERGKKRRGRGTYESIFAPDASSFFIALSVLSALSTRAEEEEASVERRSLDDTASGIRS